MKLLQPADQPIAAKLAAPKGTRRVICDAHLANGGRCTRKSEPSRRRCRYHGGKATGPTTAAGKARVTLNLPRRSNPNPHRPSGLPS
ncbi:HGGxSTG domain-containing protein [Novilysobacter arseniciresistens]|uniref:HGGxSTG domain-containing protein n=1 Tax=Novilysobacter arseniciresistens TaxID=1385522 RepID=UPI003CCD9276